MTNLEQVVVEAPQVPAGLEQACRQDLARFGYPHQEDEILLTFDGEATVVDPFDPHTHEDVDSYNENEEEVTLKGNETPMPVARFQGRVAMERVFS